MTLFEKLIDTFRLSRIRVHVPRRIPEFCNPSEVCAARAVARVSSGNAELALGKFVTRNALDERFERITSQFRAMQKKTTIRKTFSKMTARTAAILPAFLVATGELGGMATAKDFLVVQLEENRTPIGFGQTGDNP